MIDDVSRGALDEARAQADKLGPGARDELEKLVAKAITFFGSYENTVVRVFKGQGSFSLLFELSQITQFGPRVEMVVDLLYKGPEEDRETAFGSTPPRPPAALHVGGPRGETWTGWRAFCGEAPWAKTLWVPK